MSCNNVISLYYSLVLYDCMSTNVCHRRVAEGNLFMQAFWKYVENVSSQGYYNNHDGTFQLSPGRLTS